MGNFLRSVVDHIYEQHDGQLEKVTLIVPSHRAGTFIKQYLGEKTERTIWAPTVRTMNEWVEAMSGLRSPDPMTLLFELYEVHRQLKGTEHAETLGSFSQWGRLFLGDINEVDSYLLPADKVFSDLRKIREIEGWSLAAEELTSTQQQFASFWADLGRLYHAFREHLMAKGMAYQGAALRYLVEQLEKEKDPVPGQKAVCFIGFNALSAGEEALIGHMEQLGKGQTFWDADRYYLDDPAQEAGIFLRKQQEKRKDLRWVTDDLSTTPKKIEVLGSPTGSMQAKIAGAILDKLLREEKGSDSVLERTAIVLADESLLLPVLNSLPPRLSDVNVTMGYPLQDTPLFGLFQGMLELQENSARYSGQGRPLRFFHKDVFRFFQHPYIRRALGQEKGTEAFLGKWKKENKAFLGPEELEESLEKYFPQEASTLRQVFTPWDRLPGDALEAQQGVLRLLRDRFLGQEENTLEVEFLYGYSKVLNHLSDLLGEYPFVEDLRTYKDLFRQTLSDRSLSFLGEPLKGVQIMGMLETRALDLDNIILLSANEQVLPKTRQDRSLIPYEVQRLYHLPTYQEKDAVFAYHFYRLMQRARNVYLLYDQNENSGGLGGGERSRFLTQLQYELPEVNPKVSVRERVLSVPVHHEEEEELLVGKSGEVVRRLDRLMQGMSPTALNVYINDPLDFYFRYIVGLEEPEEVEDTIEARTMGENIHQVLEDLYRPWIGHELAPEAVANMKKEVRERVEAGFSKSFPKHELRTGKNLLILEVTVRFLQWFLESEKNFLKTLQKQDRALTILSLEESLEWTFPVEVPGGEQKEVRIRGVADRVDRIGDQVRVIDYKTGRVDPGGLKLPGITRCMEDPRYRQSLQLLTYALMKVRQEPLLVGHLTSGILSFRSLSQGVMNVKVEEEQVLTAAVFDAFEEELKGLVCNMYDPKLPFRENPDKLY